MQDSFLRRQARAALDKVFVDLIQDPANRSAEEIHASALRCIADMADVLAPRAGSDETRGFVGDHGAFAHGYRVARGPWMRRSASAPVHIPRRQAS